MFLGGIGLAGYRSFGPDLQLIGPFQKINLFIGRNNSGKSNIAYFLHQKLPRALASISQSKTFRLDDLDLPKNLTSPQFQFAIGVVNSPVLIERIKPSNRHSLDAECLLSRLMSWEVLSRKTPLFWFPYFETGQRVRLSEGFINDVKVGHTPYRNELRQLHKAHHPDINSYSEDWSVDAVKLIRSSAPTIPSIYFIPAIRQVEGGNPEEEQWGGRGLVKRLAALKDPHHDEQHKSQDFEKVNRFLRVVTGNDNAYLQIPHTQDVINVSMDGRVLPLHSLGTGIHEVVILAAAATVLRQQILCIEEPEIHLHPSLQKKLIRYLADETDNQYFITTHSSSFLDASGAAIFHVRLVDGWTQVEAVDTGCQRSFICNDLGYRASDLVQANAIIWVEGPSDRLYLNHWLRAVDPSLVEGLHYSIMFYGGRLLDHLTADDQEVTDFISLRRLNRNVAIVIDSDRSSSGSSLNETKERVCREVREDSGLVWVTEGREIENYVAPEVLRQVIQNLYPKSQPSSAMLRYSDCLTVKGPRSTKKQEADKIKVASLVVSQPADLKRFDLEQKMNELVQFIRQANTDK